jgi:hypothetical protein
MSRRPDARRAPLLLAFALCLACAGCTGLGRAEEVKVSAQELAAEQAMIGQLNAPGVDANTLWSMEAQYLDGAGMVLSDHAFDVAFLPGEWHSELAPIRITPGYKLIRDPGEMGDGAPDLSSALALAPSWLNMRMTQRIVPLNETQPLPVPEGAKALRARLLQVCPLDVRRMRQFNRRPRGDVIAVRTVKEEMRWWEYKTAGPCRSFTPEASDR